MYVAVIKYKVLYMSIMNYVNLVICVVQVFYILADFLSALSYQRFKEVLKSPVMIVSLSVFF